MKEKYKNECSELFSDYGHNKEKVANTSEKVCVVYDDIRAEDIKDSSGASFDFERLDLNYYIDTAVKQYKAMMPE